MKKVKGYKVMNSDWTCRGFKYEVGETYKYEGDINICNEGFHYCEQAQNCFNYYDFDPKNIVCEVEANDPITEGDKSVTAEIKILRQLTWDEVLKVANIGSDNTGHSNSGNSNSGNWNSGNSNSEDWNSGNWNSGNWNSGNSNSGNWNSGHSNSGDWNSGDWNSGNWNSGSSNSGNSNSGNWNSGHSNSGNSNSGNWNSGDWNSGSSNSGLFNTNEPKLRMFNKESDWSFNDWHNSKAYNILNMELNKWVWFDDMTDEEKKEYPKAYVCDGYLKRYEYKEACAIMAEKWSEDDKEEIRKLPNFDDKIFEEITGIDLTK